MLTKEAKEFYAHHKEEPFFDDLIEYMTSGPIRALILVAEDAIAKWRNTLGPTDADEAIEEAPESYVIYLRWKEGRERERRSALCILGPETPNIHHLFDECLE